MGHEITNLIAVGRKIIPMGYFHQEKNVEEYIKLSEGYDGHVLIAELKKILPRGSSILELGMGPGKDIKLLGEYFQVIGSDYSRVFINRYKKAFPNTELLLLDAITLETDQKFQCIYSNKVLIHLTREELIKSIKRQAEILKPKGIICHSFWLGDKEENYNGLRFVYYTAAQLRKLFSSSFKILKIDLYTEIEKKDSLLIIAEKE